MLSEVMLKQKSDVDLNVECIEYEAKSFFFSIILKNISQITNLTTKKVLKTVICLSAKDMEIKMIQSSMTVLMKA